MELYNKIKYICERHRECFECPFATIIPYTSCAFKDQLPSFWPSTEVVVDTVDKWFEEHPKKTRQSEFLKTFPNAATKDGVLCICPEYVVPSGDYPCNSEAWYRQATSCDTCKKKYWLKEEY